MNKFDKNTVKLGYNELGYNEQFFFLVKLVILVHKWTRL